jgi:endonuclease/exonuclease/phosphatase family metal-dependent hydrolase
LEKWIRDGVPTVVMGDMNEDLFKENNVIKDYMSSKGFCQLIEQPTFDKGSLIDHVYINKLMLAKKHSMELTPVYYSDHDVLSLYILK